MEPNSVQKDLPKAALRFRDSTFSLLDILHGLVSEGHFDFSPAPIGGRISASWVSARSEMDI